MILNLSLFSFLLALELLLSDLDAFATEVGERLDDVGVVVFDAVGHVTVDEEGGESENESLDLEVLPNLAHLLEDELEEGLHGTCLLEHGHSLSQVVPEAHEDALE